MRTRLILVVASVVAFAAVIVAAAVPTTAPPEPQQQPGAAMTAYEAPVDVDTAGLPGPTQPIFFRHDIHAGQYQIDCQYCHIYLELSPKPGIPTLSTCLNCHLLPHVGAGNPEVAKLRETWESQTPIEWVEVHKLAPFVHFPHQIHVNAALDPTGPNADMDCTTCHGEIERMPQVYQYAPLKMGWCLDCHKERGVTRDCTACHY